MQDKEIKLSAVIITYNEEKNIERCIRSLLPVVDEVIVWDSFSNDSTKEICLSLGVKFHQEAWAGFSESKNKANAKANGQYILSIDADEELTPELASSILEFIKGSKADVAKLNRLTNYCGQWIFHGGWYPEYKIRIFRKGIAEWRGNIHEELFFFNKPSSVRLIGNLLHYSFPSIEFHANKVIAYAALAAAKDFQAGKKYNLITHGVLKPFFGFIRKYFLQLGFLDGYYGFVIAIQYGFERFLRYAEFRQLRK